MADTITLVLGIVASLFVLTIFGGGGGYLIWLKIKPKKETYLAYIYQITEGKRFAKDKNGKIVGEVELKDLRPFSTDVLEKVDEDKGITRYRLQKLGKPTNAISSNTVENWGPKKKIVRVLYHEGNCTLLECGYDEKTGQQIYNPVPYDRINQMKDEMHERKSRFQKDSKSVLEAVLPYVAILGAFVMIFSIAYLMTNGLITMSETLEKVSENLEEMGNKISTNEGSNFEGPKVEKIIPQETKKETVINIVDG
jgi:hypothetical protein